MVNIFRLLGLPQPPSSRIEAEEQRVPTPPPVGPTTVPKSDSPGFEDLGEVEWARREDTADISRFLRYIVPDDRHSIPHRKIAEHLLQGDVVIVDLRMLAHMEAQKGACRRRLLEIAQDQGLNAFVLDVDEDLIMVPGTGVAVDVDRHVLGLESEPI